MMKSAYGLPKKREEVVKVLQQAFTDGNLDEMEYERRLEDVYSARLIEDLEKVVNDFPEIIKMRLFPSRQVTKRPPEAAFPSNQQNNIPQGHLPKGEHLQSFMSNQTFNVPTVGLSVLKTSNVLGEQRVDISHSQVSNSYCEIRSECILGSTIIDLRNENLEGKHVELFVNGVLGEVTILVPKGVNVLRPISLLASEFSIKKGGNKLFEMFKGKNQEVEEEYEVPFTLNIRGSFFLGSIVVKQK